MTTSIYNVNSKTELCNKVACNRHYWKQKQSKKDSQKTKNSTKWQSRNIQQMQAKSTSKQDNL